MAKKRCDSCVWYEPMKPGATIGECLRETPYMRPSVHEADRCMHWEPIGGWASGGVFRPKDTREQVVRVELDVDKAIEQVRHG
jgi:hypothetical protein